MSLNYLGKQIPNIMQSFELNAMVFSLVFGIVLKREEFIFLFLGFFVVGPMNIFFKNKVFQPILSNYHVLQGERPDNASDCGAYSSIESLTSMSTSYGFPSGHSQLTAFFVSFIFFLSADSDLDKNHLFSIICVLSIILFGQMFARVHRGCHTVAQTIGGAIFGIIMGYGWYQCWLKVSNQH